MIALVEEYARLSGARVERRGTDLLHLRIAPDDAPFFADRTEYLLALDVGAVERHPESELPVIGGGFWTGLLDAVRERGARRVDGVLPITVTEELPTPDVPVVDATVATSHVAREVRGVVRLAVRLSFTAGTTVEEEIVESRAIDRSTGHPVPDDVARAMSEPAAGDGAPALPRAAATPALRLIPTILRDLEEQVSARIAELQRRADRELAHEVARIDQYYQTLRDEVRAESGSGSAALATIEREHEKRRSEEIARHQVHVEVEPLQVLEREVATEHVTWVLESPHGTTAELHGQRYLTGDGGWGLTCAACGEAPDELTVCRSAHAVGAECTAVCTICEQRFCHEHGPAGGCAIDGAPVCEADADECSSCGLEHCTGHRGRCEGSGHYACVECLASCAICARATCTEHTVTTGEDAPRGARVLCKACVTYCEGATSEPIGIDESTPCDTCGKHICERHQVLCVMDRKPHCSTHLRRADRSRRFVCESHRATCDFEPEWLFAEDEVHTCVECGKISCNRHGAACHEDDCWHCTAHLAPLQDVTGAAACTEHRTTCQVDGRVFSMTGTAPCEICDRLTCRTHTSTCSWCDAKACSKDMQEKRCVTCTKLAPTYDPPDEVLAAAAALDGDRKVKQWHVARDGARFVVQQDLGWTRRIVFSVPHGSSEAVRVLRHSLFGAVRGSIGPADS
jgi:hypothetical protein